jgi:DNA-binding transcriptional LysR family regulator
MMDWDEVRFFLAVVREGSVRSAADHLTVNHSTVIRRIAQLEKRLAVQLFEKTPSGYRLTSAGEEIVEAAEDMDAASNRLQTRVLGRDQQVRGRLRATMPQVVASHLLMREFIEFAQLYPEVDLEVLSSDNPVNLTNRDADVAIRVVYDRDALPQNLHGVQGPELSSGVYISRDLLTEVQSDRGKPVRWIIKNQYGHPEWTHQGSVPVSETMFRTTDAAAQIAAVQGGLGITLLPCFVGDADPSLTRVPGSRLNVNGTLWILTQGETRKTKRVRLLVDFLSRKLAAHAPLLAGSTYSSGEGRSVTVSARRP